jgi:hypothetical protein
MSTRGPTPSKHASRTFRLEAQLCGVLSASVLRALDSTRRATMLSEVQVGRVIPDLLIVCAEASGGHIGDLTGFESWIVAELLRARSRRTETLASRLFARPEKTAEALNRLERRGAIHRASPTTVMLREDWFPRKSEVVAVEAKLVRWREAIEQATDYLRFANRSYVALPAETLSSTKGIAAACRSRGIGLMSVSRQGVDLVRKAPLHRTSSPGWVWVVGRAFTEQQATRSKPTRARSAKHVGVPAPSGRESRQGRRL